MEKNSKPKTYSFREMPDDIFKIILKEQNRIKLNKGVSQFSIEKTIYSILREWDTIKVRKD